MSKNAKNAIEPTRAENYSEWYQQVIKAADLAETSATRGAMVIKPWGYAIWEHIQRALDDKFKETGHVNAYFPLLIPVEYLEKEAAHVEGFAKECAVVTHHRLESDGKGGLKPAGELEHPYVIRPTSETIIGASYAKWVQSYRDLPILINQWANVMRWEMRTRLFLRTSEFLWQEGHTVHATAEEAVEETLKMLDVYEDFAKNWMAMPVIKGQKTPDERFAGAVDTYSIEAMMQDGKALQAGTSHFLGQNFATASGIKFSDQNGVEQTAWTTSWGVSTRLIGGLIMTHSDDDGLVLPPKLAPQHLVLMPIYKNEDDRKLVLDYCKNLQTEIKATRFNDAPIRVMIDDRDTRGKTWDHIKKGVPLRLEIGPRDIEKDNLLVGRRDKNPKDKTTYTRQGLIDSISSQLQEVHDNIYQRALTHMQEHSKDINSLDEFEAYFKKDDCGFAYVHWNEAAIDHPILAQLRVTPRNRPLDLKKENGICIFTGKESTQRVIFAKAY